MEDFIPLIDKTTALTLKLFDILSAEREALRKQDIAIFEQLVESKLELAQALQAADQQRDSILKNAGFMPGTKGVESLLLKNAHNQALVDSWQAFCVAASLCKEENLLVGTMIRKSQAVTDQALQVLRKGNVDTPHTYSASGNTAQTPYSKPLGKA